MYKLHPCPQVEINLSPKLPQIICQKLYFKNKQLIDSIKRIMQNQTQASIVVSYTYIKQ